MLLASKRRPWYRQIRVVSQYPKLCLRMLGRRRRSNHVRIKFMQRRRRTWGEITKLDASFSNEIDSNFMFCASVSPPPKCPSRKKSNIISKSCDTSGRIEESGATTAGKLRRLAEDRCQLNNIKHQQRFLSLFSGNMINMKFCCDIR